VPHAPEISLWLADEVTPIWRLTEDELGEMGLPPPFKPAREPLFDCDSFSLRPRFDRRARPLQ